MRRKLLLFLAGVTATAAVACVGPQGPGQDQPPSASGPKRGGLLHMVVSADPIDWDPTYNGKTSPADDGQAKAFDSLLTFKNGPDVPYTDMIIEPNLAERWEVSPDGKAFTFHLRKGVKFANLPPVNGRELTSADVKWTVEYSTRTGEFAGKNLPTARAAGVLLEGYRAVKTPDPYTVTIEFAEPFVPFVSYAASTWSPIVARDVYERDGDLKDTIVGTGLYQLDPAASQKGTRYVWKRHAGAWDADKAYVDEIRWVVLPQDATAHAAFQTKQLDFLDALAFRSYQEVQRANPDAVAHRYMQPQGYHLHFSLVRGGPFNDVRVRRAVAMAIDRDELNKVVAGGQGEIAATGAMHGLFTEAEIRDLMKYNPDESRRLLREAGYPNGGPTLEWPIEESTSQDNITWFELVQAQLKRAGVDVVLNPMAKPAQRAKRRAGDFDFDVIQGLGLLEADADSMMMGVYHSKSATNYGKSNDPEMDRLLAAQRRETSPEKRREIQREAVRRAVAMAWGTELVYPPKWDVTQPYVRNYHPHFSVKGPYVNAWLDK